MDAKSAQYIEQELVISTTTNSADKSVFEYTMDGNIIYGNGDQVTNTLSSDFLGFHNLQNHARNRVTGNYHCGTNNSLYELQTQISKFLDTEETLVLGSYEGLCAEIMEVLLNTEDVVIYDAAMSTPLRRGVKYCQAEKLRYPHNNMEKLEEHLKLSMLKRLRVIVTDGIFFDSGDCALLKEIQQLAAQYEAIVIVDDSFGFLTSSKNGKGSDAHCGVSGFQDLKIVNMQNSLCCNTGVFVTGNSNLINLLKLRSKTYRYSMSPSENDIQTATQIIESIKTDPSPIQAMRNNAHRLCEILQNAGFGCNNPAAGIVSFVTDMPISKVKDTLRALGLVAMYTKIGKQTLASLKVSASCNFNTNK
ncbi:MAG: aminotransferase class I/II-fold pyridoxal phosphate-dependent enzyme [Bacteroidales bacterium]|nr:aminotransferase class I/II-fold pyridoxal phosphate-dependent enzyme [Bacteroidales bacterium]